MHPNPTTKLLLLLLVLTTASTFAGGGASPTAVCVPQERDALLAFKRGVRDLLGRLTSWRRGDDCCRWRGVRCSNRTGHVLGLRLGVGSEWYDDPFEATLSGQISLSLFSLEHLEHLDLGWNSGLHFPRGGHSPKLLSSLKNLRYLNLSGIRFERTLHPQLGNLSKLQYLDLSDTYSEKPRDLSWLTRLPLLCHLNMDGANLSKVHDWPHTVNMIPSLEVLSLSYCSLQNTSQQLPHLNLTKLEKLDLSGNDFHHLSESCWFWNLTSVKHLYLGYNNLYGQFPNTLGRMKSLQVFDFSYNNQMAIMTPNLLRNLCNLEVLNLRYSLSYGNMTELYESLPHSSKLRELDLRGNNIIGTIPAGIGQLTSLVTLDLSGNHLIGHVPSEISMLSSLTSLYLGDNNLTGVITEEHFSGLTSLKYMDLSYNPLEIAVDPDRIPLLKLEGAYFASCQMGPWFPSWLQRLVNVHFIDISNTGITDELPHWFSTALSNATFFDMSYNQIHGSLPKNMEFMSLNYLYLDSNRLTGEIPPLPRNLTHFSIPNNALSGHIPGSMCKSESLELVDLSNNRLEGEFPQFLGMRNIETLVLSNNMFSGEFPSFLQSTCLLRILDLSRNRLSGRLPTWIGNLTGLHYLGLSHNMFSGSIPSNITNLDEMYHLNLACNRLSGVIPRHLSNLERMVINGVRFIQQPSYNLTVVTKGQERYYGRKFYEMVSIDLSLNFLTGVIPEEIASLGALLNLNLSWNHLTGQIPRNIGSMQSLESLDLSRNKLSGEIPPSISNITYLEYLDLSYNNLSGRIPPGSQLDTLYDSNPYMYSGNIGLCGSPLPRNCSGGNATNQGNGDHKRSARIPDGMFFHLGLGSGFVVGIWVVLCTMLFKKIWRIAYFRLFDRVYDKLCVFIIVGWARLAHRTRMLIGKLG